MNGGPTIVGIRASEGAPAEPQSTDAAPIAEPQPVFTVEDYGDGDIAPSPWRTIVPAALAVLSLLWVAGLVFLAWPGLPLLSPVGIAQFTAALLAVPILAVLVWLASLRTSTAEAQRFGASARSMRAEAAALQRTVAFLANAIDENRVRLADQARELAALGDTAGERLATVGRGLSEEIDQADIHARSLAQAAEAAQSGLQVLLTSLPRAQSETEAMTARLEKTGLAAGEQAAALDARLASLAERGREAEAVASGAAQKLAAHIQRMEATSDAAGNRLEAVTGDMSGAVDALLDRTANAVDQARQGIAAQGDAMLAMVNASQAALDTAARESAESLAERIGVLEIVIDRIAQRLDVQRSAGAGLVSDLEGGLGRVSEQLDTLHTHGVERSQTLAASISALGGSADAMTESLKAGDVMATRAIATAESLLIALDASAREIDETLPDALARLDQRISVSQAIVGGTKPELHALVTAAETTHDAIEAIAHIIGEQRRTVEHLSGTLVETLSTGRAKADALGRMVDDTIGQANRFADEAAPRLLDALLRVRDTAAQAAERARETLATVIPDAAQAIEQASADAMRRAAGNGIHAHISAIAEAADAAVAAATGASDRLERQLHAIGEATAIVETRIEDARAERESADQDHFARRASLLIEALNSASIDITRTFSPEVADSAWSAYLKGDRGVFTRRAVRLLDTVEQRDIHRLYDDDAGFRDQVNRYIHDFESMLRTILAQRDGSPLGVTLLSSDMGKLYVALAQAIERLR